MISNRRTALVACMAMGVTAALAEWARPNIRVSDRHPNFKLAQLFPQKFADWREDDSMPVVLPPPDQQALLDKIYNQTLARTYINARGKRIMLSVAYGGDQSDGLTVHVPDVCYVGQGFRQVFAEEATLVLPGGQIPVRNLMMVLGARQEPVTYWVLMGDVATVSNAQRRLVSLRYGLRRMIPEGMLVRVSSINANLTEAVALHTVFVQQLVGSVPPADRERLVGRLTAAG